MHAPAHPAPSVLRRLLEFEAGGGLVLMAVTVLALALANSSLAPAYFTILNTYVLGLSILHWINDALMAVFFLSVGLEIKRELLDGQLSTWPRRIPPGIAAAGGMIMPALIYIALNLGDLTGMRGWAIPAATDIAFALGVLSLLSSRVPVSLKMFLTALAILDDLGAIVIIAVFYTADLSLTMLALSGSTLIALFALNRWGVSALWPYLLLGAILWYFVLQSGVHATIAGVALAMTIPIIVSPGHLDDLHSPLHRLEHDLQSWVAFLIVPLFGFANAGVSLSELPVSALLGPVPLGIAFGLFIGKQGGVFAFSFIAIRSGWAKLPANATWLQLYGISLLCGIGFTMSIFIGLLAFPASPELQSASKVGVLSGSLVCGAAGALLLRFTRSAKVDHHARIG